MTNTGRATRPTTTAPWPDLDARTKAAFGTRVLAATGSEAVSEGRGQLAAAKATGLKVIDIKRPTAARRGQSPRGGVILDRTMTEPTAPNMSHVLAAQRWMEDEHGMERASLSPVEYVAYRMRISPEEARVLVAAVHALDEDAD